MENKTEQLETENESVQTEAETSTPEPEAISDGENDVVTTEERDVSKLSFDETNIIDLTINDMKQYDYITDVAIEIDEGSRDINIVVQVSASIDKDAAKMAGEDVVRYLAFCASTANSYYSAPGSTDIGGIYKKYNLLIYVDDGTGVFDMYGAKVKTAESIHWQ